VTAAENLAGQTAARAVDFTIADPGVIRRPTQLALRRSEKLNTQSMFIARGDQLSKADLIDAAIVEYSNALKISPDNLESATKLAELLLQKRKVDEAYNLVRGVEYQEPNNRALVILLSRISAARGNYEQAARYYQRLLFVNDKDIEILNLTAAMFEKAGNIEQAKLHYGKSLAINPEQPEIRKLLEAL
jgi:Flp pilus assembly protein TadD